MPVSLAKSAKKCTEKKREGRASGVKKNKKQEAA